MSTPTTPTALVTGATGVAGSGIIDYLANQTDWQIVALSRTPSSPTHPRVTHVSADMLDQNDLREKLKPFQITHLFHAAEYRLPWPNDTKQKPVNVRAMKSMLDLSKPFLPLLTRLGPLSNIMIYTSIAKAAGLLDPQKRNLAMLRNTVEVLEKAPHDLKHVSTITGGRHNGMHLGPHLYPKWKIPFEESDPPHPGPSWYFDIEGYLRNHGGRTWTWSVARPSFIIGFTTRAAHNFGTGIAVYATLLKKLGKPLIFPGGEGAYNCLWEASDATLIGHLMHWSSIEPAAANQPYNITNGEPFRWRDVWPRIADYFGMKTAITKNGFSVQQTFRDKEPLWQEIVAEHKLQPHELRELVPARFLDESMVIDWDVIFSLRKARNAGFNATIDNTEMFIRLFNRLREKRIIP